jgi:hypothetical protein
MKSGITILDMSFGPALSESIVLDDFWPKYPEYRQPGYSRILNASETVANPRVFSRYSIFPQVDLREADLAVKTRRGQYTSGVSDPVTIDFLYVPEAYLAYFSYRC